MGIVFDIIIALILLGSVYRGYKKGIVDIGFKLVSFIVSLLIAILLYGTITNLVINNTDIDEKIEHIIKTNASINTHNDDSSEEITGGIEAYMQSYSKNLARDTQNTIVEAASKPIARNVIGIVVMILLFLGSKIILLILKSFTNIITNIPIIKQLNEIAGLIYGLLIGLLIIYVILAITFFVVSMNGDVTISSYIQKSFVTKFFYNNNLILDILFKTV